METRRKIFLAIIIYGISIAQVFMNDIVIFKCSKKLEDELNKIDKKDFLNYKELYLELQRISYKYKKELTSADKLELTKRFLLIGYLTDAEKLCNETLTQCTPESLEDLPIKYVGLFYISHIASQCANHDIARKIFFKILAVIPEFLAGILWHYLFIMSYDIRMNGRKQRSLSEYSIRQYKTRRYSRPKAKPLDGRPLRVGYVSGDFKIHPVGLLIYGVIGSHNKDRIETFAYSTIKKTDDSITKVIAENCFFQDVSQLNDDDFEDKIREDNIDILVDLSGYTDGGRLSVFVREPAPCMISWLGYWATTGIRTMDAVILDHWHAPENEGYEKAFSEPIYRLPCARFCFRPAKNTPDLSPCPPVLEKGYITFGCFNNTMKYSGSMLRAWAEILQRVPDSRLILKWQTFHDEHMCDRVRRSFQALGVNPKRIEFRGMSSYIDMLKEYGEIDIALDTFPFSGGITTCNALWQGVPLVTLEGDRVCGRQGHAILNAIDLPDFSARNVEHYINIACGLAENKVLLSVLRASMRYRMATSSFLNVASFTQHLEQAFFAIYKKRLAQE